MESKFDKIIDRRDTHSYKWDVGNGKLPMFVADMDFPVAPSIIETLQKRISHPIFGYSSMPDCWFKSYESFFFNKYGWKLEKDNLLYSNGIIPTISTSVREFSDVGDEILVFTPVYHVFYHSIENNNRAISRCPLIYKDGEYFINWEDFENKLSSDKCTMLIFCNPHNPSGKIWNKEELERIGRLCNKYGVTVISDEVHGPITKPGLDYIPFASVNDVNENISITAIAPTKAWNIAGLQTSAAYVGNKTLRDRLETALNKDEVNEGNVFSYLIPEACFIDGLDWLNEMREYVENNYAFARKYIEENMPNIIVSKMDATYLMWINFEKIAKDGIDFCKLMEKDGLIVSRGDQFGEEGKYFFRLNVACPRKTLEKGLSIIKHAYDEYIRD